MAEATGRCLPRMKRGPTLAGTGTAAGRRGAGLKTHMCMPPRSCCNCAIMLRHAGR